MEVDQILLRRTFRKEEILKRRKMSNDIALKILKIVTVVTGKHVRNSDEIISIKLVFRYSAIPTVKMFYV